VDEIRVFYDISGDVVEILAIVPKQQAATWLASAGELNEKDGPV
jgi:mRNA interferase RelE/StbE